jgi:sugar phosphate isomerase/epimerase
VYPYLPPKERGGLDVFKALAGTLNRAGEECRNAGLQFCYHNHAFEFEPLGSTTGMDTLLSRTDKKLVGWEMDIFWVSVGGHNPIDLLRQHAGRVPLLHLKNKAEGMPVQYTETVPKTAFREAGNGSLDFPAILRAASAAGVRHYFVEQDQTPGDPLESLRQSYDYLHKLKRA